MKRVSEFDYVAKSSCPGCFSSDLGDSFVSELQPVILNYRFSSADGAAAVPRRNILLRECRICGLIFNSIFDLEVIPYDSCYENRQDFSDSFSVMLSDTAESLGERYLFEGGRVLEVGCGKGDFLALVAQKWKCNGVGYDTSCERSGVSADGRLSFHKRYVTPEDVDCKVDLIICRHVIEHVPEIGAFLSFLHELATKGNGSVVYLETPAWEWIVKQSAFWDVFYEHCNYFSMSTLRILVEQAGFEVIAHNTIFGGQYQSLELKPGKSGLKRISGIPIELSLGVFSAGIEACRQRLQVRLLDAGGARGWAVWGAGAKGVSIANEALVPSPSFVVDSNPAKQGSFVPGTKVPVVAPTDSRVRDIAVILIMNPYYENEIRATLSKYESVAEVLVL